MKLKYLLGIVFFLFCHEPGAQQPNLKLRIADSLSAKTATDSGRIILRSELDSLIKLYAPVQNQKQQEERPLYEHRNLLVWIAVSVFILLAVSGIMMRAIYRQKKLIKAVLNSPEKSTGHRAEVHEPSVKGKRNPEKQKTAEEKIEILNREFQKLAKENDGLQEVIKEYNGIHQEYETLRQAIQKAYKVKKYPGNEKSKKESESLKIVIDTEKAVADHAYEKFLKPLLAIADANKNSPAHMDEHEREKILDLIISLSFLYIEYLYLRINDLSVGGAIVERIKTLAGGKTIQPSALPVLNRQSGSRALVVKMALDKATIANLTYPVFDETNLNPQ